MSPITLKFVVIGGVFFAGFAAGWGVYHARAPVVQGHADAVRQADKSLILQRDSITARAAAQLPGAPELPKGAKLERAISATIQPRPVEDLPGIPKGTSLPPTHISLSLVRMPDGGERVIVKSPDGEVTTGADLVIAPPKTLASEHGWGVGGFWNPSSRAWGPVITKDLGPFRVGAEVRIERLNLPSGSYSNNSVDLMVLVHF